MPKQWISELDAQTLNSINKLVSQTMRNKMVYEKSDDPVISQIWIALGEIKKEQEALGKKLQKLENPGTPKTGSSRTNSRLTEKLEELEKMIDTVERKRKKTRSITDDLMNY